MVSKPKFSWEVCEETYSLLFKVTSGDRETTWRIGPRPNPLKLADALLEVVEELGDYEQVAPAKPRTAPQKPDQSPDVVEDTQMSEEDSAKLRAAKARAVEKTGRPWHSNMNDEDAELPLYEIGHGGE